MGDVFAGRYELVDPLGEGGVGVVWRVWDRKRQRYCAAKVLRQVDATSLLRFIREQSLRLHHPHVLAPTGWAGEDDKVLFTMPMIRGGSVNTLVGDFGPLPSRLTVLLLDQLLAALETIHAEGLVHRDVKPANLLLDATGRGRPNLWLGDFGIAAGVDEPRLTQGPYALGTPGYLAPECLRHGWDPDPRADLYSAGMCTVEMILGVRPDGDTDPAEALETAELPHPVPRALKDVVLRMTAASLTARTQSAVEARRALAAAGLLHDVSAEELLGEVEVFDQVPPLPEGWTEHGPAHGQTQMTPAALAAEHQAAGSAASAPPPGPALNAPPAAGSADSAPVPTGPVPTSPEPTGPVPAGPAAPEPTQPSGSPERPPQQSAGSPQSASPPTQGNHTEVVGVRPAPTVPVYPGPSSGAQPQSVPAQPPQDPIRHHVPQPGQQPGPHPRPEGTAPGAAGPAGAALARKRPREGSPARIFVISSGLILLGVLLLIFTLWIATG